MFISFLKKNENTRNTLFSILREREVHMNTLEESFIVRSTILCSIPEEEVLEVGESPECLLQKFWTIREKQATTMSGVLQIKKKGS